MCVGGGGGEGFGGPTPVTLQPLMVWLPNIPKMMCASVLSSRHSLSPLRNKFS